MAIQFICPNCLADLRLKDQYAGKCLTCPHCQAPIVIPEPDLDSEIVPRAAPAWMAVEEAAPVSATPGVNTDETFLGHQGAPDDAGSDDSDRLKFNCDQCGKKMGAAASAAGRQVTCPKCGSKQRVPTATSDSTPRAASVVRQGAGAAMSAARKPEPAKPTAAKSATRSGAQARLRYFTAAAGAVGIIVVLGLATLRLHAPASEAADPSDVVDQSAGSQPTGFEAADESRSARGTSPGAARVADKPRAVRQFPGRNLPPRPATVSAPRAPAVPSPTAPTASVAEAAASPTPDEASGALAGDAGALESAADDSSPAEEQTARTQSNPPAPPDKPAAPVPAATIDPAAAKQIEEFLVVVERTTAVRERIVAVAQGITDAGSARRLAVKWADLTYECQQLLTQQSALAGQEFVGPQAIRYAKIKARDDEQSQAVEAEMARIQEELPDVMPLLNAELAKRDSGEVTASASDDAQAPKTKNPARKAPPSPALKRVRAK